MHFEGRVILRDRIQIGIPRMPMTIAELDKAVDAHHALPPPWWCGSVISLRENGAVSAYVRQYDRVDVLLARLARCVCALQHSLVPSSH